MVRQLILVLSLILFWGSSHAVLSELARQGESAIQGLADIKMAPLRYLDVLFGANPGGLRGLHGGIYDPGNTLPQTAAVLQALKAANILAGIDTLRPGYSKISAGVGQGSDLITIIKNTRPYYPYLTPTGIPGHFNPMGWLPGGPGPNRPGGTVPNQPGRPSPVGFPNIPGRPISVGSFERFPGRPIFGVSFPGGSFPGGPLPGGSFPRPFPSQSVGIRGGVGASVGGGGGIFGNGGLFGTGIFGQNGLFGTGLLSGPSLDPFGIFTPFGNFFGGLGNLFGFSSSSSASAAAGASAQGHPNLFNKFGLLGRGLQGSISVDLDGTLPSPKGILGGLLSPLLGVLG
ncbi:ejaculatory bulb-specific protein 1 [Drosophila gunungcola]|uniref:Ejaculatory bulb-specific protein 1 n=1 Tax=Drosophila gunungcola TaxID=103775 RepID=A0A9P9YC04_9MUSC|nr:ejaculatory bulb-specific protein 1 [Drosophila gunungcola]KAI8034141.1 hypothetical protein M5D96_013103 [Drosophila gunungcola]